MVSKCTLSWFLCPEENALHFIKKDTNVSKMNDNICSSMAQHRKNFRKEFEGAICNVVER